MPNTISEKALVIFSGGQDSTTCLYWAKTHFKEVHAISFFYGQLNKVELLQARKIAKLADIKNHSEFDLSNIFAPNRMTGELTDNDISIISENLPSSFVSGRNLLFSIVGLSYGAKYGIKDIVLGVCQNDYNNYPDCRRNTMDALQLTATLGMGLGDIRIHTPLMYKSKAETWKMAKELGCIDVIINETITDYDGDMTLNDWGYGDINNKGSIDRARGYYEAKEKGWI